MVDMRHKPKVESDMSVDEDRLPSRPLRNWFLAWHIHTGDPPEVIARGFGLEEEIVTELISGEAPLMMSKNTAVEVCRQVRIDPADFWIMTEAKCGWAADPIEPAVAHLVDLLAPVAAMTRQIARVAFPI